MTEGLTGLSIRRASAPIGLVSERWGGSRPGAHAQPGRLLDVSGCSSDPGTHPALFSLWEAWSPGRLWRWTARDTYYSDPRFSHHPHQQTPRHMQRFRPRVTRHLCGCAECALRPRLVAPSTISRLRTRPLLGRRPLRMKVHDLTRLVHAAPGVCHLVEGNRPVSRDVGVVDRERRRHLLNLSGGERVVAHQRSGVEREGCVTGAELVLVIMPEADEAVLAARRDGRGNVRVVVDGNALAAELALEELPREGELRRWAARLVGRRRVEHDLTPIALVIAGDALDRTAKARGQQTDDERGAEIAAAEQGVTGRRDGAQRRPEVPDVVVDVGENGEFYASPPPGTIVYQAAHARAQK